MTINGGNMQKVSKKLLAAVNEVGGKVQKTGYNSFSKYHYITESDINEAVLPALTKAGLVLTTSVVSVKETASSEGQKNRFAEVILVHKVIDSDSGECLEFQSAGTGADTLDKAVYKAVTGACKYFMMKLFMISGDTSDPENDGQQPAPAQTGKGFGKKPEAAPAAAPAQEKKGFMAKKAEAAAPAPAAEPSKTEKKPSFGKKPANTPAQEQQLAKEAQEDTLNQEQAEQDAAY